MQYTWTAEDCLNSVPHQQTRHSGTHGTLAGFARRQGWHFAVPSRSVPGPVTMPASQTEQVTPCRSPFARSLHLRVHHLDLGVEFGPPQCSQVRSLTRTILPYVVMTKWGY